MTRFNDQDERIAAYMDGQMSSAENIAFEAEVETSPTLAEAVERYNANDRLLRAAFDAPMQQPVDDALLARMGLSEPANVINLHDARNAKSPTPANDNQGWRRWRLPMGGAIAAALVALVMTQNVPTPSANPQFAKAMESLPSGQSVQIAAGEAVQPLLTFKAGDGRYCREFSRTGAAAATGIACRGSAGWTIEAEAKGGTSLSKGGQIETATGADVLQLDQAYAKLKASDPLDGKTEQALISGGWATNRK